MQEPQDEQEYKLNVRQACTCIPKKEEVKDHLFNDNYEDRVIPVPLCVLWEIWHEHNSKTFEGVEHPNLVIKNLC
jgi:hypothetical protein